MKLIYVSLALTLALTACGGGKDEPESASKNAAQTGAQQGNTAATSTECQGGVTASGTLCAAKQPLSPSPVLETM